MPSTKRTHICASVGVLIRRSISANGSSQSPTSSMSVDAGMADSLPVVSALAGPSSAQRALAADDTAPRPGPRRPPECYVNRDCLHVLAGLPTALEVDALAVVRGH